MRTFTDTNGQDWTISLTWDKAEQIAARVERPDSTKKDRKTFDLLNSTDKEQVDAFVLNDPYTGRFDLQKARCIVAMLYVLCEEQCKERKISPEDFALMMQASFGDAFKAFMEEYGNFIPCPDRKEMFQNLMFLAENGQSAALSEVNQTLRQQRTALGAAITQRAAREMAPAVEMVEKAVAGLGMTASSKSAGRSASRPASKRLGKS